MTRRRILRLVIVGLVAPAAGLVVGLVANAAAADDRWPGPLDLLRAHPWEALAALACVSVALGLILDRPQATLPTASAPEPGNLMTLPAPNTLPRDVPAFTAREGELSDLLSIVDAADAAGNDLPVVAVDGMPGVGKTAFAIHVAHRLADRFPHAQLYVNLQGHSATRRPLAPVDVLASLLSAIGKRADQIPGGTNRAAITEARAALWRSSLNGLRTILILDDAAGHEQVVPLLPNAPGCLVVVTSRRRLAPLTAVSLSLEPMRPDGAARLFARLIAADLSAARDELIDEIVELCGYLPLAIAVLAGRLRHHPKWSVADLASRLREAKDRLAEMQVEDLAVAAAFELSYAALSPERQRFFRLLGAHPGPELEPRAVAALTGTSTETARRELEALYGDHLLDEVLPDRYRMHDLLRFYSRKLMASTGQTELREATTRLFTNYLEAARVANQLVARRVTLDSSDEGQVAAVGLDLTTREEALSWLTLERANLFACVKQARDEGDDNTVLAFTSGLVWILRHAGPWDQAIALQEMALAAAKRLGNMAAQGTAMLELGVVRRRLGDLTGSEETLADAFRVLTAAGDIRGQANALNEVGITRRVLGDVAGAMENHHLALERFRTLRDDLGQARSLNYLAIALTASGSFSDAIDLFEKAIEAFRRFGDRHGEADARTRLGVALRGSGDLAGATTAHRKSLTMFGELGDRHGQGVALNELGATLTLRARHDEAKARLNEALEIFQGYGNRHGLAEALNNRGSLFLDAHDHARAHDDYSQALAVAREIDLELEEARALEGLGMCALASGNDNGLVDLRSALTIYMRLRALRATTLTIELDKRGGRGR